MSLWQNLRPPQLGRARPEAAVSRAMLDLDAGALLEPTDYPYRTRGPIPPFGNRIVLPLGNYRHDQELFPPTSILARTLAHIAYPTQLAVRHGATRQAAGADVKAKSTARLPWLFGGPTPK